ncbi:NACHT domain-containing protein [Nonomuraea sp. NPDC050451]|uniref:NACHT domain-containing protein n=1 Tax=Nonomuraea sp. NPDC050451 TaxID=3364364 RepID=UPI0037A6C08D
MAIAVVAIVALGVLMTSVVLALNPAAEVSIADVAALALTAAAAVVATAAWARQSPQVPAVTDLATAAAVLAGKVHQQWRAEARMRSLDDPEPIPLCWQLSSDKALMSPLRLISSSESVFPARSDDIPELARAFRALKRRRLVIVGEPGMGKTTLAVQLLLQLLATRAADQAAVADTQIVPVPVLFPVSSWDTTAHPRLHDWLAERLKCDYPALSAPQLGAGAAAALAERGWILPVLDGLDEIPDDARAKMIEALNASLTPDDQLILTSRTAEFAAAVTQAGRPLNAAAVITPKLLTPADAVGYLTACLPADPPPAWQQVLSALSAQTPPGLTELASTPLGLWLIRTVYIASGADPAPLAGPLGRDSAALRAHLLDRLIPVLIQARPPSTDPADHYRPRRRLNPDTTSRYLAYLARCFPPAITRDIAWWHIARTIPYFPLAAALTIGLTTLLGFGLAFGLVGVGLVIPVLRTVLESGLAPSELWSILRSDVPFGLRTGLRVGLVFGLALGLAVGLAAIGSRNNQPSRHTNFYLRRRTTPNPRALARRLAVGSAFGLVVGPAAGFVVMPEAGLARALATGLVCGLAGGLAVALLAIGSWVDEAPGYADLHLRPGATPRRLTRHLMRGLAAGLAAGLTIGLTAWLMFKLATNSASSVVAEMMPWVIAGTVVGLGFGLIKWAEQPTLTSISTPRSSWQSDRALTCLRSLVLALTLGLLLGLAGGLWVRWWSTAVQVSMTVGVIVFGLVLGFISGLIVGNRHAWLACTIAVAGLAVVRRLPWRIMDFLDDAHRVGLLRTVGPVYQFRHAAMHDHLAAGDDPDQSDSSAP